MVLLRRSGWIGASIWLSLAIALILPIGLSCQKRQVSPVHVEPVDFPEFEAAQVRHPDWSYDASIYEVNIRQYSPGGTFAEFEEHLPRLKDMGVDILWFMPIHPIGQVNRKGTLGSYYSVKDYYGVNPEFGTLEEFKALVEKIHAMGMHVLIDWVANHTSWDNDLTRTHPEWYIRDVHGNFVPPVADWSDVIDLNYNVPGLWYYMSDAMRFWVEYVGVDGFRCDVAGMVPLEFWNYVRVELDEVKPVFMLAEWEAPEAHDFAFDMTYAWGLDHLMAKISKGMAPASGIGAYLAEEARRYPRSAYRMNFTSNHDENSWNGTVYERMGDAAVTMAVLAATLPGMPLIYSGQEVGLNHRLEFFEKDEIKWHDDVLEDFYTRLLGLKKSNHALWNGYMGGDLTWIHTTNDAGVFAFLREKEGDRVFVILNLSGRQQIVTLEGDAHHGDYRDAFTDEAVSLDDLTSFTLDPWDYRVLSRTTPG
ncbi:MAG: alpha-amylase family glycosyl hydrolase, partial [bacterium]